MITRERLQKLISDKIDRVNPEDLHELNEGQEMIWAIAEDGKIIVLEIRIVGPNESVVKQEPDML